MLRSCAFKRVAKRMNTFWQGEPQSRDKEILCTALMS